MLETFKKTYSTQKLCQNQKFEFLKTFSDEVSALKYSSRPDYNGLRSRLQGLIHLHLQNDFEIYINLYNQRVLIKEKFCIGPQLG